MPASLPGDTLANNLANPSAGKFVIFDPLSGPKGSPLDVRKIASWSGGSPTYSNDAANQSPSTGALSTGIGIGGSVVGQTPDPEADTAPEAILRSGFNDNDIPGEVPTYAAAPPVGVVASSAINSTRMYIGGGRSVTAGAPGYANVAGVAGTNPYTAGIAIVGAGQGASRDGGAGPAYLGFPLKMVTAAGAVAAGAAIETGYNNVSGGAMVSGQSAFAPSGTQLAAAS